MCKYFFIFFDFLSFSITPRQKTFMRLERKYMPFMPVLASIRARPHVRTQLPHSFFPALKLEQKIYKNIFLFAYVKFFA